MKKIIFFFLYLFCFEVMAQTISSANEKVSLNELIHVLRDYNYELNQYDAHNNKIKFNPYGYPVLDVSFNSIIKDSVYQRAKDTIKDRSNYYVNGFNKAMHRNGICFSGEWVIDQKSEYTGLLSQGTRYPLIARASVSLSEVDWKTGQQRSFGLVGKILGTHNPDQKVETANFFTVDDLNGTDKRSFVEKEFYNQPPFSFERLFKSESRLVESTLLNALMKAVPEKLLATGIRELFPLTEYNLSDKTKNKEPRWLKLKFSSDQPTLHNSDDFRNEIDLNRSDVRAAYPEGIKFDIFVSKALPDKSISQPVTISQLGTMDREVQWVKLGFIRLTESYSSYGCDFMLHYHHADFRGSLIENVDPKKGKELNKFLNFFTGKNF